MSLFILLSNIHDNYISVAHFTLMSNVHWCYVYPIYIHCTTLQSNVNDVVLVYPSLYSWYNYCILLPYCHIDPVWSTWP